MDIGTPPKCMPCQLIDNQKLYVDGGGVVYIHMYLVVIVSANGTEDRWFESRLGTRFLRLETLQCCSKIFSHFICTACFNPKKLQ
jgi:hypothetical protein